jgi:hypothetical protein
MLDRAHARAPSSVRSAFPNWCQIPRPINTRRGRNVFATIIPDDAAWIHAGLQSDPVCATAHVRSSVPHFSIDIRNAAP